MLSHKTGERLWLLRYKVISSTEDRESSSPLKKCECVIHFFHNSTRVAKKRIIYTNSFRQLITLGGSELKIGENLTFFCFALLEYFWTVFLSSSFGHEEAIFGPVLAPPSLLFPWGGERSTEFEKLLGGEQMGQTSAVITSPLLFC